LIYFYTNTADEEIMSDCLTGLSFLADSENQKIIKTIIVNGIEVIMEKKDLKHIIISSKIRILGGLLSNSEVIADRLIDHGCIEFLENYIFSSNANIRKETLWALSNIAAGSINQIKKLIDCGAIAKASELLKDSNQVVVREVLWLLANLVSCSDLETCLTIMDNEILNPLINWLNNSRDPFGIKLCLQIFEKLLRYGQNHIFQKCNPFAKELEKLGVVEILEKYSQYKIEDISEISEQLIENYFKISEEKFNAN
jgi:importin subunit alpha-1